jgi:hypothetical protein
VLALEAAGVAPAFTQVQQVLQVSHPRAAVKAVLLKPRLLLQQVEIDWVLTSHVERRCFRPRSSWTSCPHIPDLQELEQLEQQLAALSRSLSVPPQLLTRLAVTRPTLMDLPGQVRSVAEHLPEGDVAGIIITLCCDCTMPCCRCYPRAWLTWRAWQRWHKRRSSQWHVKHLSCWRSAAIS